jgi:predicted nucleic acid-binding protein
MFLTLATTAHAEVLVSGDNDLLSVRNQVGTLRIMTPAAFLAWLEQRI